MVNVASPTFNGAVASADSGAKAVMDGEPRVQKPRRAASFVLWPSSTLAWPWIIHFAIEVVVFCVDHDGERLTTNAPQRCGVGTRVGFTSTPATRREPRAPVLVRSANDVDDDERSCARIAKHVSRGRLRSIARVGLLRRLRIGEVAPRC